MKNVPRLFGRSSVQTLSSTGRTRGVRYIPVKRPNRLSEEPDNVRMLHREFVVDSPGRGENVSAANSRTPPCLEGEYVAKGVGVERLADHPSASVGVIGG